MIVAEIEVPNLPASVAHLPRTASRACDGIGSPLRCDSCVVAERAVAGKMR
jgi:hypothetical protein